MGTNEQETQETLKENEAADSSPAEKDVAEESSTSKEGASAEQTAEVPKSLSEALEAVVEETAEGEEVEGEEEVGGEGEDAPDAADVPFNKHPRWQELQQELRAAKERAERFDELQKYLHSYGITQEQFTEALELLRLARTDPVAARERLEPLLEQLDSASGNTLPEDLLAKVEAGLVDEETAKELAKARAQLEALQRNQQATAVAYHQRAIAEALNGWEAAKQRTDPDYAKKQALVQKTFIGMLATSPVNTPEDAVKLAEAAYNEVTGALKPFAKRPVPARTLRSDQSSSNVNAKPKPTSLRDAIRIAAEAKGLRVV